MIAQLACFIAFTVLKQDGPMWTKTDLPMPPNSPAALYYQQDVNPLEPPRQSPKRFGEAKIQWPFPWLVTGFVHLNGDPNSHLIFRVYAQEQKGNRAAQVARMLLRLSEFNLENLKLIHSPEYHNGIVDVFLCFGGRAGGEQLFDQEFAPDPRSPERTIAYKVNTIYFYDMSSFTDPVEMAREVAHEYGHATLPPVGGFKDPEEWAGGYLGEKISLRWMRDALAKKELTPEDAMGATKEGLDKWLAANADPLILNGAQTQPTPALLADKSAAGMNAFIGLGLYIETIYPDNVFKRSLMLCGYEAKDYPAAVVLAAEEPEEVTLKIPLKFIRKAIWIPLGTGKLTGAPILKKDPSGWVQIQVGANPIVITNVR